MNPDRLEQIESKIAFLEGANSELSDLLFRQHREMQSLTALVKQLAERLNAALAEERVRTPDQERPPHY